MNQRSLLWGGIAVVQALAIVALSWSLFGGSPSLAAPEGPQPDNRAAASPASPSADDARGQAADESAAPRAPADAATGAGMPPPPPMGTLLIGRVRAAGDFQLPQSVYLSLQPEAGTDRIASTSVSQGTDTFAWPEIPAGRYRLTGRGDGMRDVSQAVEVPEAAAEVHVEVVLEQSWILPVLLTTPDGRPLHEALSADERLKGHAAFDPVQVIALWNEIPDPLPTSDLRQSPLTIAEWKSSRGFDRGSTLPARYAGELHMPERRPAFAAVLFREVVLAKAPLTPEQQELTFVCDPAQLLASLSTLRLQVLGPDGAPLAGAKIGVNDAQSMRQPTATDAEGRVELTDLKPGRFRFSIQSDGLAMMPCELTVPAGAQVDLGQLRMTRRRDLELQITDAPAGDKLSGSVTPLDAPPHPNLSPQSDRLWIRDGKAALRLAEGRYRLRLTGAGGAVLDMDTRTCGDGPLTVSLQPEANLQVDSTSLDGPTRLVLETADGSTVLDRWVTWKSRWDRKLLPGTYRATIQPLGGAARTLSIDVPPDGATLGM